MSPGALYVCMCVAFTFLIEFYYDFLLTLKKKILKIGNLERYENDFRTQKENK